MEGVWSSEEKTRFPPLPARRKERSGMATMQWKHSNGVISHKFDAFKAKLDTFEKAVQE